MNTDARLAAAPVGIRRGRPGARFDTAPVVIDTPLQRAIIGLAREGQQTPCAARPDMFMADDRKTRLEAEVWCTGCPAFDACDAEAMVNGERFGVWAGHDRTPGRGGK